MLPEDALVGFVVLAVELLRACIFFDGGERVAVVVPARLRPLLAMGEGI